MVLPAVPPGVPPESELSSATLATVTINDTAYAVPLRVAETVLEMKTELAAADRLRVVADSVARAVPPAVTVATIAVAAAKKKPGFFSRLRAGLTDLGCAGAGAGAGAFVGKTRGAVVGAVGVLALCKIAR